MLPFSFSGHLVSLIIIFHLIFPQNFAVASQEQSERILDVVFLTQSGSRVLKRWDSESLLKKTRSNLEAQAFIFEESASELNLEEKASIDLVTIVTDQKTIRVPRFLIWRGLFKIQWNLKEKAFFTKISLAEKGRILVPGDYFNAGPVRKIELSNHALTYPLTKLKTRTNPAASRGEKIFVQSCLSCHSVSSYGSRDVSPFDLKPEILKNFQQFHRRWPGLALDSRSERGLVVYSEALGLEQNGVKAK